MEGVEFPGKVKKIPMTTREVVTGIFLPGAALGYSHAMPAHRVALDHLRCRQSRKPAFMIPANDRTVGPGPD